MKKVLPVLLFVFATRGIYCQTSSIRVVQAVYSGVDPDGAGPATGSVTIQFELLASPASLLGDGMGLSFVYQSSKLMPTPTNTTTPQGPVAAAAGWNQMVDNRAGTDVSVTYGGQTFDKRMIITFNQLSGLDNLTIPTVFTAVAQVTYWTLGSTAPEGGYITAEDGTTVPQNSLSSDGGLTSYNFLSPDLNTPVALGSGTLPVLFTKVEAKCNNNGALVSWSTPAEFNSDYFELQHSSNGNDWTGVKILKAAGTSSASHTYQVTDFAGGVQYYRIKGVDKDGQFVYTAVMKSNCSVPDITVNIYPVPAKDLLNIVIGSKKYLKTKLLIVDGSGKLVRTVNTTFVTGNNSLQVDLKGLPSGDYLLHTSSSGNDVNKSFSIIR